MKIAFPSQESLGLESQVYAHFGSARYFVIVDSNTNDAQTIENKDLHHLHGNCRPLQALGGETVDAVVVGGIGRGALMKLKDAGIATYRAADGTVLENLQLMTSEKLPRFSVDQTCAGHDINGECIH